MDLGKLFDYKYIVMDVNGFNKSVIYIRTDAIISIEKVKSLHTDVMILCNSCTYILEDVKSIELNKLVTDKFKLTKWK